MSTMQTPDVALVITPEAAVEVKKFMEAEGVTAEQGGLRVAVMPGRMQRLQVQPRHRRQKRRGRSADQP